jgi:hypothetical protein
MGRGAVTEIKFHVLVSRVMILRVSAILHCPDHALGTLMYVVFQDLVVGRPIVYTGSSVGSL